MKRILPLIVIILSLCPFRAAGQIAGARADSASVFKPAQLIAPGVLMTGGVLIHAFAHDTWDAGIRDAAMKWRNGGPELNFDDYIQYLPLAVDLGLGATGVKAKHCFVDRTIEAGITFVTFTVVARGLKAIVNSERPNGGDFKSFPSGHTCTAFAGAELIRMEYGWGWGAGAYAVAATVGVMRVYNDWHWASDVLLGAGIGILSAHVGEWLLQPFKNLCHIPDFDSRSVRLSATIDPVSGIPCASLAFAF